MPILEVYSLAQVGIIQHRFPHSQSMMMVLSVFFFNIDLLFIYFLAALGLAVHGLSLVVASGPTLRCGGQASHCSGFSSCGAQALGCGLQQLWHAGSVVVAHGLSSCGARA